MGNSLQRLLSNRIFMQKDNPPLEHRPRHLSLEFFKASGIIFLIFLHQIVWLFIKNDTGGLIEKYQDAYPIVFIFCYRTGLHVLGLQIPLLAGTTFFLSLQKKSIPWLVVLKRAFFLILIGFLMDFLTWGFADAFTWDVLQFIALSMIVAYPFARRPPNGGSVLSLFILGTIALYFSDRFPSSPFVNSYLYVIFFGDAASRHYWPFCPWFASFACGILIGHCLLPEHIKKLRILPILGAIFLGISLLTKTFFPTTNIDNIWGNSLFKSSPFFVLGIMGFSLIAIPLLHFCFAQFPSFKNFFQKSGLIYFGQGILWIYLLTTIIGYHITCLVEKFFNMNFHQATMILPILIGTELFFAYCIGKFIYHRQKIAYDSENVK